MLRQTIFKKMKLRISIKRFNKALDIYGMVYCRVACDVKWSLYKDHFFYEQIGAKYIDENGKKV